MVRLVGDYPYANGVVLRAAPMPDYLQAVVGRIAEAGFGSHNAVLINRYRDGKDYISAHSDDDYGDDKPTIPSLTLGPARPFRLAKWLVKDKKLDKSATVEYMPGHGDLLGDARHHQRGVGSLGAEDGEASRRARQSDVPKQGGVKWTKRTRGC